MGASRKFYALYEVKPGMDHVLVEDSCGFISTGRVKMYRRQLAMQGRITGVYTTLDNEWPPVLPASTKLIMEKVESHRRGYSMERKW